MAAFVFPPDVCHARLLNKLVDQNRFIWLFSNSEVSELVFSSS